MKSSTEAASSPFQMPAEWERHSACWMLWPHRPDNWRLGALPAQKAFLQVASAIAQFEPLNLGVPAFDMEKAKQIIESQNIKGVNIYNIDSDDCWMRDTGPTFVFCKDEKGVTLKGVDWSFNAYGITYYPFDNDLGIAGKVALNVGVEKIKTELILEGGSIHVDGEGTLLTTEECLLNPNRNPNLSKEEIEKYLKYFLGVDKIIWLRKGLFGDLDTDGHIDNICCFTKPGEVLLAWTDDDTDEQYEISRDALKILESTTDAKGRKINVIKLPIPPKMFYTEEDCEGLVNISADSYNRTPGVRLAASYINFYIANGGIVCPSFNAHTDSIAKEIFQKAFPDRKIVQVPGRDILLGGGNIHCITQQQPSL